MSFPNYGLELSGGGHTNLTRRSNPQEVSQSQREFVDLAFRMALMSAAASNGAAATLVVDAPETSLDAIFTVRAAEVLARFAKVLPENRLIITSNLIAGELIPELIKRGGVGNSPAKIVNLLNIATPTAAVRHYRKDYEDVFSKLMEASHVEQ